nr:MAG TPA: minor tail protein [Caudoviricetes sp.]
MAVDGYLNFDTRINTKGFAKGISGIKEKLVGIKSAVSKFGTTIAAAFSTAAIVSFSKSAIESAAEIKAANSQMEQTFGSLYNAADEAMKRVAETSGIVQTRLQGVGTSIYAFAKTSGMDSSSALKMMEEALQVTADSAAYYDRSLEETSESLQSFLKGNFENDAALGLSCTETTRNAAANKLYGKSFQELSESQKQLTLLQMVKDANALSGALGQASREADGWENVIGNLKEAWKQFLAIIGQPILQLTVNVIKQMTATITKMTEYAQNATNVLSKMFGRNTSQDNTVSMANNTQSISDNISDSVENQNELTQAVEETAKAEKNSLAGFDEINTITDNTEIEVKQESQNNNIIPSQTVEVTPVLSGSVEITADTNPFEDAMKSAVERIKSLIQPFKIAWEDNSPQLVESIRSAFENIKELIRSVAESFETVWENGSGELYISNIIILFSDLFGIIGDIAGALTTAWNDNGTGEALIQSYFDRWNALLELIHVIANDFREVWNDGTGIEICSNVFEIITNINETVTNLRERFQIAWQENETGKGIIQGILDIFNTILKTINDITSDTKDWAETLDFTPLLTSIQGLLQSLAPFTENIGSGLEWFYNNVLLPLASWTIENIIPAFLALLSAVIKLLNAVITTFKPLAKWLWDNFLQPIAEWTGGIIVSVINGIADALTSVSDWITEHQTLVQDFVIILASIGTSLAIAGIINAVVTAFTAMGGIMGILVTIELGLQTITTVLAGAFTALLSPVILIPVLIGAVIAIGILLIKHWNEVKAIACGIWESIQETLYSFFDAWVAGWNSIKDFIGNIWQDITGFFAEAWKKITEIFKNIGSWFSDRWNDIKNALFDVEKWFGDIFRKAYTKVTDTFKNIGNWFSDRWDDIKNAFSSVGKWFKEKFQNARDNISQIFDSIGEWFSNRWDDIKNAFQNVGNWFGEKFQLAWDGIKNAFSGVKGFFEDVWNGITGVFSHVTDWFKDKFSNAWEAVKNVFSKGGEIFTGITDGIFDTFKTIVNGLIDGINWVISQPFDAINWALDGIRDVEIAGWYPFEWLPSIDTPQIPYLAQGTVVPANYGNFLAVLGDNKKETEVVSPLSTIEQAVANAMKNNSVGAIHVHVELDGREIGRVAVKAVNENKLRGGA